MVLTPLDGLQTNGPLPTMKPPATGSNEVARSSVGLLQLLVPEMSPPHTGAQTASGMMKTPPMLSSSNELKPFKTTVAILLLVAVQLRTLDTAGKKLADGASR